MTSNNTTLILAIVFILAISFNVRGQVSGAASPNGVADTSELRFDTSATAIIPFNSLLGWGFDSTYKQANLTQPDLQLIDSLLLESVANHNGTIGKNSSDFYIDLNKHFYKKQLVVVLNRLGQKEVWVNCFCNHQSGNHWKTAVVRVSDGGNCYFNFKINLATKICYDFAVNGVA